MPSKLKRFLKFLFSKQAISESLSWGLDRNWGRMRPEYESRNDFQSISVDEGVRVEVYWKKLKIGKGPAFSLFMLEEEILRIDCFGKGAAHLHAAFFLPGEGENRLWMPESSLEEQIDRACFELRRNYRYYQARIPNPNIRALKIDSQKMESASQRAHEIMNGFLQDVSQLNDETLEEYDTEDIA
jgi:hypothetical protein